LECTFRNSYPQVYPQNNLTDYIIRQSRSGVKWSIVEYGAFIRRGVVIPNPKPSYPANLHSGIISQTFISVKPSCAWFGHCILSCKVCQAHFMQKKSPIIREKFDHIVMLFKQTFILFIENQEKRFVIL
jgi:hypothetical protein